MIKIWRVSGYKNKSLMVCTARTRSNCKKEFVAHDTVSLTLKCNRLVKMGAAGQHHPVIVEIAGRRYERTYSLTQIDAEHLRLTVKKLLMVLLVIGSLLKVRLVIFLSLVNLMVICNKISRHQN